MDEELKSMLEKAHASGATDDDLVKIIKMYENDSALKKKVGTSVVQEQQVAKPMESASAVGSLVSQQTEDLTKIGQPQKVTPEQAKPQILTEKGKETYVKNLDGAINKNLEADRIKFALNEKNTQGMINNMMASGDAQKQADAALYQEKFNQYKAQSIPQKQQIQKQFIEQERVNTKQNISNISNTIADLKSKGLSDDSEQVRQLNLQLRNEQRKPVNVINNILTDDEIKGLGSSTEDVVGYLENLRETKPDAYESLLTKADKNLLGGNLLSEEQKGKLINDALNFKTAKTYNDYTYLKDTGVIENVNKNFEKYSELVNASNKINEYIGIYESRKKDGTLTIDDAKKYQALLDKKQDVDNDIKDYDASGFKDQLNKVKDIHDVMEQNSAEWVKANLVMDGNLDKKEKAIKEATEFREENPIIGGANEIAKSIWNNIIVKPIKGGADLGTFIGANIKEGITGKDKSYEEASQLEFIKDLADKVSFNTAEIPFEDKNGNIIWGNIANNTANTITQMLGLMVGGSGATRAAASVGAGVKTAAKIGTVIGSFGMARGDYYDEYLNAGMSVSDASKYADGAAALTSLLELVAPNDAVRSALTGTNLIKKFTAESAKYFSEKGYKYGIQKGAEFLLKEIGGENAQEIFQNLGDLSVKYVANQNANKELFDLNMKDFLKDTRETIVLTTLTTGIVSGFKAKGEVREQKNQYKFNAAENYDSFMKNIPNVNITEEEKNKVIDDVANYKKAIDSLPSDMKDEKKREITPALVRKNKLETIVKDENLDDVFKDKAKAELEQVTELIKKYNNGDKTIDISLVNDDPSLPLFGKVKEKTELIKVTTDEVTEEVKPTEVVEEVKPEEIVLDIEAAKKRIAEKKSSEEVVTEEEVVAEPTEELSEEAKKLNELLGLEITEEEAPAPPKQKPTKTEKPKTPVVKAPKAQAPVVVEEPVAEAPVTEEPVVVEEPKAPKKEAPKAQAPVVELSDKEKTDLTKQDNELRDKALEIEDKLRAQGLKTIDLMKNPELMDIEKQREEIKNKLNPPAAPIIEEAPVVDEVEVEYLKEYNRIVPLKKAIRESKLKPEEKAAKLKELDAELTIANDKRRKANEAKKQKIKVEKSFELEEAPTEEEQKVLDKIDELQAKIKEAKDKEKIKLQDELQKLLKVNLDEMQARFRLAEEGPETPSKAAEVERIKNKMNKMSKIEAEFEEPSDVNKTRDVSPLNESKSTDKKSALQKLSNFLGKFNTIPLIQRIEDFKNIPMILGMSDILASGNILNSIGKSMKVDGGLLFNVIGDNIKLAWAGVNRAGAQRQYDDAVKLYNGNKELFQRLWAEGKLPDGHVPMAILRMGNTAINSNEAVYRYIEPYVSSLPEANRKAALNLLLEGLKSKAEGNSATIWFTDLAEKLDNSEITTVDGVKEYLQAIIDNEATPKDKRIKANLFLELIKKKKDKKPRDIQDIIDDVDKKIEKIIPFMLIEDIKSKGITTLDGFLREIVDQSKKRAEGEVNMYSLPVRSYIYKTIFSAETSGKNELKPIKELLNGVENARPELFTSKHIYETLGEPSMVASKQGDVVSIVGIKVAEKGEDGEYKKAGGVKETKVHNNYGFGPEGRVISLIENPKHGIDVFPEFKAKAARIFKESKAGKYPSIEAVANQTAGAFFADDAFKGARPMFGIMEDLNILIGKLRFAFPEVQVTTSKEEFDAILNEPGVRTRVTNGKILYGLTKDGRIFLNPDYTTLNTPIHEFGHIWIDYLRSKASGKKGDMLLAKGFELVKPTKAYKDALKKYENEEIALEEALVELMANKGVTIIDAAQKSKFKSWMNATFKYIKENFIRSKTITQEDIKKLTLDKFINIGLADLFSGEKVSNKFNATEVSGEAKFSLDDKISKIVELAKKNNFSDAAIKEVLKSRGYTNEQISAAFPKKLSKAIDIIKSAMESKEMLNDAIEQIISKGNITIKNAELLRSRVDKLNLDNEAQVAKFLASAEKMFVKTPTIEYIREAYKASKVVTEEVKKANLIKDIVAFVKSKAKISKTPSGKIRSNAGLEARGQAFFSTVNEILKAATNNDLNRMIELSDELSDTDAIDNAVNKELNGERLTVAESNLLDKVYAFDTFGDIMSMTSSEVKTLFDGLKDVSKESSVRLKANRIERAKRNAEFQNEATEQIKKGFKLLFRKDGSVKDEGQRQNDKRLLIKDFKEGRIFEGIKKWKETMLYKSNLITDLFRKKIAHLGTFSNLLDRGGDFFTDNIYRPLNRAIEKSLDGYYKQAKKLDSFVEGGVKSLTKQLNAVPVTLKINGEDTVLTKRELLTLYALSKNDVQNQKLADIGFTSDKIKEIEDILGKEVIEFADKVVDYLSNDYYESINDVYQKANNLNLPRIENYFPTRVIKDVKTKEQVQEESSNFNKAFNAEYASALKARTDRTSKIDIHRDFFDVVNEHFKNMENFKANALLVKDINAIFKTPAVAALTDELGVTNLMNNLINLTVNPNYGMPTEKTIIDKVSNKYTGYALAFKPIQALKQATAFISALEDYQYKKGKNVVGLDLLMFMADFSKVIAKAPSEIKKAYKMSANVRERLDASMNGDIIGLESGARIAKTGQTADTFMSRLSKMVKVAGGSFNTFGDIVGVLGYMANYNRDIKNGMSQEDALERFNNYNSTQSTKRATEKGSLQQSKDETAKIFTMFGSATMLQMNKVSQSYTNIMRDISSGKKPKIRDVRSLYLNLAVANVLFTAASNVFKYIKGSEDDEEKVLSDLKEAMMGLNLLYQLPLVGTVIELGINFVQGDKAKQVNEGVNAFIRVSQDVLKGLKEDDYVKAARPLAELAAGFKFDVFTGVGELATGSSDEDTLYDILGVSKSYRPTNY